MKKFFHSLQAILLLIRCFWIIGWRCLYVLLTIKWHKSPRHFVDSMMRQGSIKILKAFKATHTTIFYDSLPKDHHYIFMSNHQSLIDLILIYATMPSTIRAIAKSQLFKIAVFGKAMQATEFIAIDHSGQAMDGENSFNSAKQALENGLSLWIFPEGSRSATGELQAFKHGSFRLARETQSYIVPVAILNTRNILPPFQFKQFKYGQHVEIRVGKAIDTREYPTLESQKKLLEQVHNTIQELMQN